MQMREPLSLAKWPRLNVTVSHSNQKELITMKFTTYSKLTTAVLNIEGVLKDAIKHPKCHMNAETSANINLALNELKRTKKMLMTIEEHHA